MRLPGLLALLGCLLALGCQTSKKDNDTVSEYREKYRPQYHFSPAKNWTNDPNGLLFYEGEYHLFYQYNPYGDKWGHMSWGHAVSQDLIHWQHLPLAIAEYQDRTTGDSTMIFSGTAVVDTNNSSGLCENGACLIAVFTSNVHKDNQGLRQHQSLAFSNDKGRTWKLYDQNPILDIGRRDFRDPKIFWYEPQQKWVMALVVPDQYTVQLYQSKNLLKWDLMSEFGKVGDTTRIWECPDLFQLPVENEPGQSKWVLSLSGGHPAGPTFVGMQYFIGEFDGTTFRSDQVEARYIDYGKDYYAGIIFNNVSDRTLMLGWINNWTYANQIPTSPWRGAMSLPRQLALKKEGERLHLHQRPLQEIENLRGTEIADLSQYTGGSLELQLDWTGGDGTIIELFANKGERTIIGIGQKKLFVNRRESGNVSFQADFASIDEVPVAGDTIQVRIFVDQSILEVYINNGEATITSQIFPAGENRMILPHPEHINNLRAWELKSAWR